MNKNIEKQNKTYIEKHKKGQFFTDKKIIPVIFDLLKINFEGSCVLEPSCGSGNFIDEIINKGINCKIDAIDNDKTIIPQLHQKYKGKDVNIYDCDFLKFKTEKLYDFVIGNPPFNLPVDGPYSNTTDAFVLKSLSHLKAGGKLIMVLPNTFLRNKSYQNARNIIISDYKIVGIIDFCDSEFNGADVETIILCIENTKVNQQKYFYWCNGIKTNVSLKLNNCSTIQIYDNKFGDRINKKIGDAKLSDYFDIYRGRSHNKKPLQGRDIDFYRNVINSKIKGDKARIVVQNIAYRLVANITFEDLNNISDTVTIIDPKDNIDVEELLVICNYLNSSIANYFVHTRYLNFCKLTIHIDKFYIDSLPIPSITSEISFTDIDKQARSKNYPQLRNEIFYKFYKFTDDEIKEIETRWSLPRFKKKEGLVL